MQNLQRCWSLDEGGSPNVQLLLVPLSAGLEGHHAQRRAHLSVVDHYGLGRQEEYHPL